MPELYPTLKECCAAITSSRNAGCSVPVVQQPGTADTTGDVLNDVVVTKAALSRILEFDVAIDGLFVSAPSARTGSSSLRRRARPPTTWPRAGPSCIRRLAAMVLTPICPHMLSNRPLVVSDRSSIEVRLRAGREATAHLTLDGQRGFPLHGGTS